MVLQGQGTNAQFVDCTFKEGSRSSVIGMIIDEQGTTKSWSFKNSIFENNIVQYAVVSLVSASLSLPVDKAFDQISLEDCVVRNNIITSVSSIGEPFPHGRSALPMVFFAILTLTNTQLVDNTVWKSNALINLVNSEVVPHNVTLSGNMIKMHTSTCEIASAFNVNAAGEYSDVECRDFIGPFCFLGASTVQVFDVGHVALQDTKIGQKVLVGDNKYEAIYSFGHSGSNTWEQFLQIKTADNSTVEISAKHMAFAVNRGAIPVALLRVSDRVLAAKQEIAVVESIKTVTSIGVYAPFTPSGKVVVNGFLASSFVAMGEASPTLVFGGMEFSHQWLAHSFGFTLLSSHTVWSVTTLHPVLMKPAQMRAYLFGLMVP